MLHTLITVFVIIVVIMIWIITMQRRLVVLDENVSNAMNQIGVQLSSRFDALMALLNLAKGYAKNESETLIDTTKAKRCIIMGKSRPEEVLRQERIISEVLERITMVTEQYPELKENQNYSKIMDAVEAFDDMVRNSRLIYNDSVTKLNRELRMFPVAMIAGVLGFHKREYLDK
jgi:LemA protein